jgi:UDP-N-acetylmuramyl pentapeptide phosphotransferase/UDP-N-acetylglucosamine-1-phosphate transferase
MNLLCKFVALALAGSVAGFLPFNFPKAKMFLGDVGSITLGFSTAVLILWIWTDYTTAPNQLLLPIFVLYFFLEGSAALLRRMSAGEKWWKPHREHFYQRLIRSGYCHTRTTGLIISIQCSVILFIGGATLYKWPITLSWVLSLLIWVGFFIYVEVKFRDTKEGSLPKL